jgi:hypothetical protein
MVLLGLPASVFVADEEEELHSKANLFESPYAKTSNHRKYQPVVVFQFE